MINGYWEKVRQRARQLHSDGCSGVPDFPWAKTACQEHDIHYRTHGTLMGDPITKRHADWRFARRIMRAAPLGVFSPTAWLYYAGVVLFGGRAWNTNASHRLQEPETTPGSTPERGNSLESD